MYVHMYAYIYTHAHARIYIHDCIYIYMYSLIPNKSRKGMIHWDKRRQSGTWDPEIPETAIAQRKHTSDARCASAQLRRAAQRSIWTFAVRSAILALTQRPHAKDRGFTPGKWIFRVFALVGWSVLYAQLLRKVTNGKLPWRLVGRAARNDQVDRWREYGTRRNGTASSSLCPPYWWQRRRW